MICIFTRFGFWAHMLIVRYPPLEALPGILLQGLSATMEISQGRPGNHNAPTRYSTVLITGIQIDNLWCFTFIWLCHAGKFQRWFINSPRVNCYNMSEIFSQQDMVTSSMWSLAIAVLHGMEQPITSGPLFTKKTSSYQYRDSHYKPETVVRPS